MSNPQGAVNPYLDGPNPLTIHDFDKSPHAIAAIAAMRSSGFTSSPGVPAAPAAPVAAQIRGSIQHAQSHVDQIASHSGDIGKAFGGDIPAMRAAQGVLSGQSHPVKRPQFGQAAAQIDAHLKAHEAKQAEQSAAKGAASVQAGVDAKAKIAANAPIPEYVSAHADKKVREKAISDWVNSQHHEIKAFVDQHGLHLPGQDGNKKLRDAAYQKWHADRLAPQAAASPAAAPAPTAIPLAAVLPAKQPVTVADGEVPRKGFLLPAEYRRYARDFLGDHPTTGNMPGVKRPDGYFPSLSDDEREEERDGFRQKIESSPDDTRETGVKNTVHRDQMARWLSGKESPPADMARYLGIASAEPTAAEKSASKPVDAYSPLVENNRLRRFAVHPDAQKHIEHHGVNDATSTEEQHARLLDAYADFHGKPYMQAKAPASNQPRRQSNQRGLVQPTFGNVMNALGNLGQRQPQAAVRQPRERFGTFKPPELKAAASSPASSEADRVSEEFGDPNLASTTGMMGQGIREANQAAQSAPVGDQPAKPTTRGRFAAMLDAAKQGKLKEHLEGGLGNFFQKFDEYGNMFLGGADAVGKRLEPGFNAIDRTLAPVGDAVGRAAQSVTNRFRKTPATSAASRPSQDSVDQSADSAGAAPEMAEPREAGTPASRANALARSVVSGHKVDANNAERVAKFLDKHGYSGAADKVWMQIVEREASVAPQPENQDSNPERSLEWTHARNLSKHIKSGLEVKPENAPAIMSLLKKHGFSEEADKVRSQVANHSLPVAATQPVAQPGQPKAEKSPGEKQAAQAAQAKKWSDAVFAGRAVPREDFSSVLRALKSAGHMDAYNSLLNGKASAKAGATHFVGQPAQSKAPAPQRVPATKQAAAPVASAQPKAEESQSETPEAKHDKGWKAEHAQYYSEMADRIRSGVTDPSKIEADEQEWAGMPVLWTAKQLRRQGHADAADKLLRANKLSRIKENVERGRDWLMGRKAQFSRAESSAIEFLLAMQFSDGAMRQQSFPGMGADPVAKPTARPEAKPLQYVQKQVLAHHIRSLAHEDRDPRNQKLGRGFLNADRLRGVQLSQYEDPSDDHFREMASILSRHMNQVDPKHHKHIEAVASQYDGPNIQPTTGSHERDVINSVGQRAVRLTGVQKRHRAAVESLKQSGAKVNLYDDYLHIDHKGADQEALAQGLAHLRSQGVHSFSRAELDAMAVVLEFTRVKPSKNQMSMFDEESHPREGDEHAPDRRKGEFAKKSAHASPSPTTMAHPPEAPAPAQVEASAGDVGDLLVKSSGLIAHIGRKFGYRDSDLDDFIADVQTRVWKHRDSFDAMKAKFSTWLHVIATNVAHSKHQKSSRRNARAKTVSIDAAGDDGSTMAANLKDTHRQSIKLSDEQHQHIHRALMTLPASERDAFVGVHVNGQSASDYADERGISRQAVSGYLKKATETMRKRLLATNQFSRVKPSKGQGGFSFESEADTKGGYADQPVAPVKSQKSFGWDESKIPDFFPTPRHTIDKMLAAADIQPGMSVLEPSAGKGDILDAIKEQHPEAKTIGIEQHSGLRELVGMKGHEVSDDTDFMEHKGQYDRIVMNPPFGGRQDVSHVQHAFEQLKPGGKLVAIMSAGPFGGSSKKDQEFRDWIEEVGADVEDLPDGTFSGDDAFRKTGVSTRMVVIEKPDTAQFSRDLATAHEFLFGLKVAVS